MKSWKNRMLTFTTSTQHSHQFAKRDAVFSLIQAQK
jgi:hypothetical protein